MICVVYGTTGELIKLAPLLVALRERVVPYLAATTGQQVTQIPPLLDELGLPQPDLWLAHGARGRDLQANSDIPRWLASVARSFARERRRIRRALGTRPLVLVHGDTMTTFLGASYGRVLGVPVAHVEGGLRTGNVRHPFPEEPIRRAVSRLAAIHYAPGPHAAANLRRGAVVDTRSNTIRDALALVPADADAGVAIPRTPFGLVSLHRFELINDRRRLTDTVAALAAAARERPLLFVDHPVTAEMLGRYGLTTRFGGGLVRIPRLRFFPYVALLRRAAFVVTDSGGSQEECYYLDVPCLVHRQASERPEGLGENAVLSRFDLGTLRAFLADPAAHRRRSALPAGSPTQRILDDLAARGFVEK